MQEAQHIPLIKLTILAFLSALMLDTWTKTLAFLYLEPANPLVGSDHIALFPVRNDALAFSIGADSISPSIPFILRITLLVIILWLTWRDIQNNARTAIGVALLVAGGTGNTMDIMFRDGAVIDFLVVGQVRAWINDKPDAIIAALNLADLWILAGLILMYPLIRRLGAGIRKHLRRPLVFVRDA